MAVSIDTGLAGPRIYHDKPTDDPFVYVEGRKGIGASDLRAAVRILWRAWAVLLCVSLVPALL